MKKFISVAVVFLLGFLIVNNSLTEQYLVKLKGDAILTSKKMDPLYEEISIKAKEYEKPPIDAKIDPIWKAIPGYNGLKVDIDASYKKMKKDKKFSEAKLIFKQVKPKVHLEDLPPSPIYKGNPDKPMVSLIINVAWGNEYLSPMLATLKKNNVQATFFLEGRWVKNHPELAKMIVAAGHEVGNHSYTHPDMKRISSGVIRQEIQKTNEVIKATTGEKPIWLAPPSGSFRDEVVQIAAQEKLGTIMWSVDTVDWKKPAPEVLIQRVMSKIHPGAIVLMHPTEPTAKALDQLIKEMKEKGFRVDTVTELLSEERINQTLTTR
ncbi:polysaccharide deacetylase family protein [Robertmurraya andreesenii]|uniref:Sporulation protein (Polysaccharide deacetylase family) n=1 Tax=Anoxybacillus andreesenii TaxID=1325932 RepID=A0ABT9V749_9BACL|nr:polysaccharide deacetylase family protein [Robertmurraya andreesenii]MDQ0156766.1 putative sporulation protein (polysaccharide deacetylase family) [Robertmurraya andreesenii]